MVQTIKFSEFDGPSPIADGDIVVGLRGGENWQFTGVGEGGGGSITKIITQIDHGLSVGDYVRINTLGAYVKAQADSPANAELAGLVVDTNGADEFTLQIIGYVDTGVFAGMTEGSVYFLSDSALGQHTLTEPTALGAVSLPVFLAETTETGWLRHYRGIINGGQPPIDTGTSSNPNLVEVTQIGNGFTVGQVVYLSAANNYALAQADTLVRASAVGVVIIAGDTFTIQTNGFVDGFITGKNPADIYWLSDVTPGLMTLTKPTAVGSYLKQIYLTVDADTGYIQETQPIEIAAAAGGGTGWTLISSSNAAGLINVDIINITSYYRYLIIVDGAIPVGPDNTNTRLLMRVSSNNGASYDSGGTDYQVCQLDGVAPTRSYMELTPSGLFGAPSVSSNVAYGGISGEISVINLANVNSRKQFLIKLGYTDVPGQETSTVALSGARLSSSIINALRFFWYPTIGVRTFTSGTFRIYGTNV